MVSYYSSYYKCDFFSELFYPNAGILPNTQDAKLVVINTCGFIFLQLSATSEILIKTGEIIVKGRLTAIKDFNLDKHLQAMT